MNLDTITLMPREMGASMLRLGSLLTGMPGVRFTPHSESNR